MLKVNKLWKSQLLQKVSFLSCSWKKNSDKLLSHSIHISQKCFEASLKGCASNVGWLKIRLQEPKQAELAGTPGPQSTRSAHILGENPFCIPITEKFSFDPNSYLSAGQRPVFGWFEALFGLPEPDFHSASIGGSTYEGSLKTLLIYLDEVGE